MPHDERRDQRLTLRLPPSLREAVELAAQHDQRTLSDWIVKTLTDAVGLTPAAIAPGLSQSERRVLVSDERRERRANAPAERARKSEERRAARVKDTASETRRADASAARAKKSEERRASRERTGRR